MGALVSVGTSLLIRTAGTVLIYAGSLVARGISARRAMGAQTGLPTVDPRLCVTACETEDGEVLVSLCQAPDDDVEANAIDSLGGFELVRHPDEDAPVPFSEAPTGTSEAPTSVVGIPVAGIVLEHRNMDGPWLPAVWDVATSSYLIDVTDDAGVEMRARATVVPSPESPEPSLHVAPPHCP